MKRLFFILSLLVTSASFAQFTDTAQLNKFIRDTIKDRRPEKVTAEQIQKGLLGVSNVNVTRADSLHNVNKKRIDSIPLNNVQNQYGSKQNAKAWLDSLRVTGFTLDSFLRAYNPATKKLAVDFSNNTFSFYNTANARINDPAFSWGDAPPVLKVFTQTDSIKNAIRSESVNWFDHWATYDTGATAWGRNKVFAPTALTGRVFLRFQGNNNDIPYAVTSDQFHTIAALKTSLLWGLWSGRPNGDSIKFTTGTGWTAPTNHLVYNDLNNGGNDQQQAGQFIGSSTYWQLPTNSGGSLNELIDYYSGGYASGKTGLVNRSFSFFADDNGISNIKDPYGLFIKGTGRRNYIQGKLQIGDSSILNLDVHKFYVSGSSKFTGNIVQGSGRVLLNSIADDGATPLQVSGTVKFTTGNATSDVLYTENSDNFFRFSTNSANFKRLNFTNSNAGAGAAMGLLFYNDLGKSLQIQMGSSANARINDGALIRANGAGGMNIVADAGVIAFGKSEYLAGAEHGRFTNAGNLLLGSTTDDGVNKLQVTGNIKLTGVLNLPATTAPTSSADATGADGDLKRDASGNIYLKAGGQWRKFTGVTF